MSKTAQKKRSAYRQGLMDAQRGRTPRWKQHPFMNEYMRGHQHGTAWFQSKKPAATLAPQPKDSLLKRLLRKIFCRSTKS